MNDAIAAFGAPVSKTRDSDVEISLVYGRCVRTGVDVVILRVLSTEMMSAEPLTQNDPSSDANLDSLDRNRPMFSMAPR